MEMELVEMFPCIKQCFLTLKGYFLIQANNMGERQDKEYEDITGILLGQSVSGGIIP